MKPVVILNKNRLNKEEIHNALHGGKSKPCGRVHPKLLTVGGSIGFVVGIKLLRTIDWRKGDFISYSYDDGNDELKVINITKMSRVNKNVVHPKNRESD